MKLWLISQGVNTNWDTYDSAVVAAETEADAREMDPGGSKKIDWTDRYNSWASGPEQVSVKLIGEALPDTKAGVICASFNAG